MMRPEDDPASFWGFRPIFRSYVKFPGCISWVVPSSQVASDHLRIIIGRCGRVIPFSLPLLTSYWKRVGTNPRYQCWFPNGINPHINPMGSLRERHQPKISNSSADGWLDVFQLLWFRFGSPNNSLFVNDKSLKGSTKLRKGDKQMYIYLYIRVYIHIHMYIIYI